MKRITIYTAAMKKIASTLLICLGLIGVANAQVVFDIDTSEAYLGDSLSIPIHVSNFTNIGSLTLHIDFNGGVLDYGSAQNWHQDFGLITPLMSKMPSSINF